MDKKLMLNTMREFRFADGTETKLTLNFYLVYQLKEKNKALYERYNKIVLGGIKDMMDCVTILYTAYCCAMIQNEEEPISEEEFMMKCGADIENVMKTSGELIQPKKQ